MTKSTLWTIGYGGLADDIALQMRGGHWHHLTDNTVQVSRHPTDTHVSERIEQVRVVVVHGAPPNYDSLVDLGGWQSITAGAKYTFTHNLNWNPNRLLVRGECSSTIGGINQWFAGGNHDWFTGWQGTHFQNLTDNTVVIARQADDQVCSQARVRIWMRREQIYLPLVLKN